MHKHILDDPHLCGGCHQWDRDPDMVDGVCRTCGRTEEQIREAHGVLKLEELKND